MPSLTRFNGGPLDGQTRWTPDEAGWPLPNRLDLALMEREGSRNFLIGHYDKTNESRLPVDHPGIARGAEYSWKDEEDENDLEP